MKEYQFWLSKPPSKRYRKYKCKTCQCTGGISEWSESHHCHNYESESNGNPVMIDPDLMSGCTDWKPYPNLKAEDVK